MKVRLWLVKHNMAPSHIHRQMNRPNVPIRYVILFLSLPRSCTDVDTMATIGRYLSETMSSRRATHEISVAPGRDELTRILSPVHLVTAFIGYRSKNHPCLSCIGLPLWVLNLTIHFALDFYEAKHVFGWAWATAMGVFFFSFVTGTYSIIKSTIPWLEDALEVLHAEGNFTETLEKLHKIAKVGY